MDLGMTKWISAGLIECNSATNLSSPGSWAVSPALNSSFPSPTPTSCATQMHSARVRSCAKGQEVLPPGQHNTIPGSWGEKRICQVQIRQGWFDLFHYWWKLPGGLCASRLIGLFCNSVSCGEHGARWTHITLVFGSSATVFQLGLLYFFLLVFSVSTHSLLRHCELLRDTAGLYTRQFFFFLKQREDAVALVPCDTCHLRLIIIRWFGSLFLERWHHLCLRVMVTVYKHLSNYNIWMKLESWMKFFCGDLQLLIKPSRLYSQLVEISYPLSMCNKWTAFSQQIFIECLLYQAQDYVLNMLYLVRQKNNYRGGRKCL